MGIEFLHQDRNKYVKISFPKRQVLGSHERKFFEI